MPLCMLGAFIGRFVNLRHYQLKDVPAISKYDLRRIRIWLSNFAIIIIAPAPFDKQPKQAYPRSHDSKYPPILPQRDCDYW